MKTLFEAWRVFWKDKLTNILLLITLILYCVLVAFVWWLLGGWPAKAQMLPPEFPLFYSLPKGYDQLAVVGDLWSSLWWLGGLFVFDGILSVLLFRKWKILSYILLWSAVLSVFLWGVSLLRIYLLVK